MEITGDKTPATTTMETTQMDLVTKRTITTTTGTMIQNGGITLDLEKSKNFAKFYKS